MTLLDRAGQWTSFLVYGLVALLLLAPSLFMEVHTAETFKVSQEFLIVILGWAVILAVAVARSLSGLSVLGGGRSSWARLALGGFAIWIMLSAMFGFNSITSWMYTATAVTYLLICQSLVDWIEMVPERRGFVFGSLAVLVAMQTLIALGQMAKLPFMEWSKQVPVFVDNGRVQPWSYLFKDALTAIGTAAKDGRPIGTIGNVNYSGEFLALMIPIVAGWALSLKRIWAKVLVGVVLVLPMVVLVQTGARAAMVGMLVASTIAAFFIFGKGGLEPRRWWSTPRGKVIVGVGAVLAIVAMVLVGGRIVEKFESRDGLGDSSIMSRWVNWQAAVEMTKDHPVLGAGIGSYKLRNVPTLAELYPQGIPEGAGHTRFLQAHNEPLQALAELGLVGLALCLLAFAFWCRETTTNESLAPPLRFGLLAGVGAALLAGLFGFPFHIPVTALMIVVALALGIAGREGAPAPVLTPAWRPVYLAVAIALLGAAAYQVYTKATGPLYMGHRYLYVAEKVAAKENSDTALVTLTLADRYDRYRGGVRWKILKALVLQKEYEAALKLYEGSPNEGLGMDALYWKARALEGLGRNKEAAEAFTQLAAYYPDSHPMDKRGKSGARRLQSKPDATPAKPAT